MTTGSGVAPSSLTRRAAVTLLSLAAVGGSQVPTHARLPGRRAIVPSAQRNAPPDEQRLRIAASRVIAAFVAVVVALGVITYVAPQRAGPLALAQILLPHIVIGTLIVTGAIALALRTRTLTVAIVVLFVVASLRFGSEWISSPAPRADGAQVRLLSWNLELGARPANAVMGPLLDHDADVVALQELTPDAASALDHDAATVAHYPYRLLVPDAGVFGVGVLSAFPIVDRVVFDRPSGVAVTLDLGSGRNLNVLNAHPLPGHIERASSLGLPVAFDSTDRDAALARVRTRIDALLARGDPVVVMGDYNTAPTEPGYATLVSGLRDVHVEVGLGPGWTWRPSRLESLGVGLLRIDLILVGTPVNPVSIGVDCRNPGDHCLVDATVSIP
jgi:endonuclease/exonuclease/phosphatase (EEP) superfamily protein YafD